MPSSKARRRRAQQRRGPGPQASPRRPGTTARPARPALPEEPEVLAAPEEPVAEAAPEEPESEEPAGAADGDRAGVESGVKPEGDLWGGTDPGADLEDEDEEETLEEQEADVEEAVAAAQVQEQEAEPRVRRERQSAGTAVAEGARPAVRSASRNRRRGAAPQPQGPAVVRFFREIFDELRKVDWPSPSELYRYTIIVIITVIVLAAFISGIDWALQQLAQRFIYGSAG